MTLPVYGKHQLRVSKEVRRKAQPLGHWRRLNKAGRQTCCKTCHTCQQPLREVLDGELWCDNCETYR
jgi:hypothetical protein